MTKTWKGVEIKGDNGINIRNDRLKGMNYAELERNITLIRGRRNSEGK